jgi:hypothetical protein
VREKPDHRRQWHRVLARQPQAGWTPRQPRDWPRAERPTPHEYWSIDLARSALLHVAGFIRLVDPNRRGRQRASPRRAISGDHLRSRAQLTILRRRAFPRDPVKAGAVIQAIRRQARHQRQTFQCSELRAKAGARGLIVRRPGRWNPARGIARSGPGDPGRFSFRRCVRTSGPDPVCEHGCEVPFGARRWHHAARRETLRCRHLPRIARSVELARATR